ncbi:hypothetical protein [Novosphingobium lindaniclasticum]
MRNALMLAALAAISFTPAGAVPSLAATAAVSQQAVWDELASIVATDEQMARSSNAMLKAMVDGLAADEEMAELETAYPGLLRAFSDALKPMMVQEAQRIVPLYRSDLAALYKANLSASEAAEIGVFLRSPQMTRFISTVAERNAMGATARDAMASREISAESLSADIGSAAIDASLQVDGADMKFIKDFFATPLGKRMSALNAQKIQIDARWSNYISPEAEAEVGPLVIEAMAQHIAKTDPEVAAEVRKTKLDTSAN